MFDDRTDEWKIPGSVEGEGGVGGKEEGGPAWLESAGVPGGSKKCRGDPGGWGGATVGKRGGRCGLRGNGGADR